MSSFLALTLAALLGPLPQDAPAVHHLAEISWIDTITVRAAQAAGVALDCQSRRDQFLEIVVTDEQLAAMQRLGARVEILQPRLEEFYAERAAADEYVAPMSGIAWGTGSMGGYFTWDELMGLVDQLQAAHPSICTPRFSIGQSVEGRDLWAVKVSDNPDVDEDEPEHRVDSMHHAREPVSAHMSVFFLEWLLENYGVDPLATHLVNEREIWILPVVNPDGYEYNEQIAPNGGGLWRKNRRHNGGNSYGVDLNRNYTFQWGYDNNGSSGNQDSETYRGPSPASEPETQAMEAFLASRSFRTANSAHTYSNLWLFPWGYVCADPPQKSEFETIGEWFTAESGYTSGTICQVLYAANGNTVDHEFGTHGTWSGTIEIGSSADGFWPPPSRIVPLMEENLRAYQRLALYAGAGLENLGVNWAESVGDGDEWWEPGEERELSVELVNPGTLATLGSATMQVSASSPDIEVLSGFHDFGVIHAFGTADNLGAPLSVRVAADAISGTAVTITADLSYDGYVESHEVSIVLGEPMELDLDDFETDLGWILGVAGDDASTGEWEIADPQQTTSSGNVVQPGDDHSPSGTLCAVTDGRAGSGAGTWDVDDGFTTLISPQFDLEDVVAPQLAYWRWFSDFTQADDTLEVDLSTDDGSTWTSVEVVTQTANEWTQTVLDVASMTTPTDRMRLRFRTGDEPNNSLVEALVDDLSFRSFQSAGVSVWRYGTPVVGGSVRLHVHGDPQRAFVLYAALGGGFADLGDLGIWELDFGTMFRLLNGNTGASGRYALTGDLPDDPSLSGTEIHLQALVLDPAGVYASNAVDFLIE